MTMTKAQILEEYALAIEQGNKAQYGGKQMSKLTEVQATIYSELNEKISAGEISHNDAVAIWEDERGIFSYSLEEKDVENHDSVTTVYDALKELAKCI